MKLIYTFLILLISVNSYSQETNTNEDSTVVITLLSGDIRIGKIISDDGREILLQTEEIGKIYITKEDIKSIKNYDPERFEKVDGEFSGDGPFTTRYYFTTNSLPIKKGENYSMLHLYGPEVHFALSDRFSLGAMSSWIGSPMVLAMKLSIPTKNENVNFGFGTLIGTSGYLNSFRGYGGLHWGMITIGDRFRNLTFSAGFSYINIGGTYDNPIPGIYPAHEYSYDPGNFYFTGPPREQTPTGTSTAPVISIAGITKVGKKASLFFDSMLFFGKSSRSLNEETLVTDEVTGQPSHTIVTEPDAPVTTGRIIGFLMPGMRFQKTDKSAFQIALAGGFFQKDDGDLFAFPAPMISWFIKF